jgi:hypothetical protein
MYAQALSKLERRHTRDLADVEEMKRRKLIDPTRPRAYFVAIEPETVSCPYSSESGILSPPIPA